MSLRASYEAFLATPSASALAPQASINYIPTLTTVADPEAVIRHLSAQTKVLTKKNEKILGAIEGESGLCLDVETTIEFSTGGGAYLPGLDDNFLADRIVVFPMVHIVQFDDQQRIRSIRLYWDQASLLKQVEVIGSRAKNWPIRDGKEQARLIVSSSSPGQQSSATSSSRNSIAGDPHASLSLFQPSSNHEEDVAPRTSLAPRATSAKPPQRDLHEILSPERAPSTGSAIQAKAGASKNFQPIRLFDQDEDASQSPSKSPVRGKAGPKKYDHFEFGDGEDATPKAVANKAALKPKKHAPQWDFEDFVTPEKHSVKVQAQNERHFGWSDDEVDMETPVKRPVVHQPRPETKAHFDFNDDATPTADKTKAPRPRAQNKGLGLYKDPVLGGSDEEDVGTSNKTEALSNVTKMVNNESRQKTFDSQFVMADSSPNTASHAADSDKIAAPKNKKGLDANWGLYDQSPQPPVAKENVPQGVVKDRGINIGGDGMGGRKGSSRAWLFGDDGPDAEAEQPLPASRKASGRAQQTNTDKSFWDF
ncbi:hypothetical protein IWZ01DRAFT_140846 [Phyllosticta capitalensis]